MWKPIVYIIQEVVEAVKAELLPQFEADTTTSYIRDINYMYGHWVELSQRLINMSKHAEWRYHKFPLIALMEDISVDEDGETRDATMNILLLHGTNHNYSSEQRQQLVFDRVLYPLYDELLKQLAIHPEIVQTDEFAMTRTRTDRKYFGRESVNGNTANVPAEFLDAIQVGNLQLSFTKTDCWMQGTQSS